MLIVMAILDPAGPHMIRSTRACSHALLLPRRLTGSGPNEFGRDVFSRLLYAARASVGISLMSVFLGLAIGTLLGLIQAIAAGGSMLR